MTRQLKPNQTQPEERLVPMRLQKFLARAGAASRRGSENLMTAGRVTVNGQVVTELGSKVDPLVDQVAVDGVPVRLEGGPVTIMLHKPAGYVTTMSDPQGRPTVAELVPTDRFPGLFPIGRLDFDTTGLLLFSTDGELGNGLLHPRHHVEKRYLALVNGKPTPEQLAQLEQGIQLDDGMTAPAKASLVEGAEAKRALSMLEVPPAVPDHEPNGSVPSPQRAAILRKRSQQRAVVRVVLREGRKRQVKRMLSAIKHGVLALHRDSFGPIELGDLPRGQWRELTPEEVAALHASIK
ncbi:pseudouridine synthase [uncultured Senegalimassilia sp.]|uniref:pseudouridine synthase n=1 Tax=uncultured Senegalimassilia sp. TaxID=1714350 RepID=UPI0025E0D3D2|nr:pseudouridine synthase [uncultured Senegalimassilia sp.]